MELELTLLDGGMVEMAALQCVLGRAADHAEAITGGPPGPADAQSLYSALPLDVAYEDKFVWGLSADGVMVGCADVIRGWPTADTAHVGLLLLDEAYRGRGLGRAGYEAVEAEIRRWPGIGTVRAAVVATTLPVLPFWLQMGFRETGEVKPYVYDKVVSQSVILSKRL